MKKAFIDQILLGFLIFSILIITATTLLDDEEARNKYYKLKNLTNNAALSAAKYYAKVSQNTTEAQQIASDILSKTKLGNEIKDNLTYNWDFISEPNTLTVNLPSYNHETFWYRFLNITNFGLDTQSKVKIAEGDEITQTSNLTPFGINGCDSSHLVKDNIISFNIKGHSTYDYEDYSNFYGVDTNDACVDSGNSKWAHFKNTIKDFYVEDNFLKNDENSLDVSVNDDNFCVPKVKKLSMEQNNDPKQISQSFKNLEKDYDLRGVKMHIALFDCNSQATDLIVNKFIEVEFQNNPSESYHKINNDYDNFEFQLKIIGTKLKNKVELIK
ncbi:MAG: hypothetical protein ACQERD_01950 [Campylobacterota bacterium]